MFTLSFDESLRSIVRKANRTPLPLIHAPSLSALQSALDSIRRDTSWVVSDLSQGAWRGCQTAWEFAQQLGVVLEDSQPVVHKPSQRWDDRMPAYADSMGVFVDAESAGDQTILRALRHAERLLGSIQHAPPIHFLVIVPFGAAAWGKENQWLTRFLSEGLQSTGSRLFIISMDAAPTPWFDDIPLEPINETPVSATPQFELHLNSPLSIVPGVIGRDMADRLPENEQERLSPLPNGCFLVPMEYRQPFQRIPPERFDALSALSDMDWLQAYARLHGANCRLSLGEMIQHAWRRFAEGGAEIALRFLEEAERRAPTPVERAVAQIQLQGLRIALLRFEEAAHCPTPTANIPQWMQGFLYQSIGWGAAMINQPQRAEPFLVEARKLLASAAGTREHLYLLNISALNRYRLGDLENALQWENQIERALSSAPEEDWRLIYLNALNTARLLRSKGAITEAAAYYKRAFETHEGVRSDGDLIYMNALNAQNQQKCGETSTAFHAWLRAALHWVSTSTPEALPRRATSGIIQPPPAAHEQPEAVSAKLLERLQDAARLAGATLPTDANEPKPEQTPVFISADAIRRLGVEDAPAFALGGAGWGVLASNQSFPPVYDGPCWNRLCHTLANWIHRQTGIERHEAKAWILFDQYGCELPVNALDLLQCALRCRLDRLIYEEIDLRISASRLQSLQEAARVTFSPALARIVFERETCVIGFKRYRSDRRLGEMETRILRKMQSQSSIIELYDESQHSMDWQTFITLMNRMQQERILLLTWPKESLREELNRLGVPVEPDVEASRQWA